MRIKSLSSGCTCLRRTGSCDGRCRQITDQNDVDLEFGLICTVEVKILVCYTKLGTEKGSLLIIKGGENSR